MDETVILERGPVPIPKIMGRGRKRGGGSNGRLLARLRPGDALSDISVKKLASIRTTAHRLGIKIKVRMMPDTDRRYLIFLA